VLLSQNCELKGNFVSLELDFITCNCKYISHNSEKKMSELREINPQSKNFESISRNSEK